MTVRFGEFTLQHKTGGTDPANLAIVLDNRVISAPSIKDQITDQGFIEGNFTQEHAKDLAMLLRSGALSSGVVKAL